MIEVQVEHREGLNFIVDLRIVKPVEILKGVHIERISNDIIEDSGELNLILKALGMRFLGRDDVSDTHIYAFYPWGYWQYRLVHSLCVFYWKCIRWLYYNARFFQQIPSHERFSWRYFTPYCWYLSFLVLAKFRKKHG